MPSKIDKYNDLKEQLREINTFILAIERDPLAFGEVSVEIKRFPGGQRPVTLRWILESFRKFLPQALNDARLVLEGMVKDAAVEARGEAQEVLETVKDLDAE